MRSTDRRITRSSDLCVNSLCPSNLFETVCVIPNLGHVADAIAVEGHHVDVIRLDLLPGGRHGAAGAGVRAPEDAVRGDVAAPFVDGERPDLVIAVRHRREQAL